MMSTVDRLAACNIAKEEYLILKALILSNSDANVDNPVLTRRLRENLLSSLSDCAAALR